MELFQKIDFTSHSGLDLKWKIEMDALSHKEWECIAQMIIELSHPFREAVGIPRGGNILGKLLNQGCNELFTLDKFRILYILVG